MSHRYLFVAVVALLGCAPRRQLGVEFSGARATDTDAIAQVTLDVFDGDDCTCLDLDNKAGCRSGEQLASLTFMPGEGDRTAGGFPDGRLVVRVAAHDSARMPIALRIACWCVPDLPEQSVVFPLGTPTDPAGRGCSTM